MSAEQVDLVRQAYDSWNRGDLDFALAHMTDDFELHPIAFPGLDEVYSGKDGYADFWGIWRDAWSSIEITVEEVRDLGNDEVLARVVFNGIGKESGVEVSLDVAQWFVFRGDLACSLTVLTPEDAERRLAERG
jgi:ketosteroid isomerase-like protein